MEIVLADTPERIDQVRHLFRQYFNWLKVEHGVDLAYQSTEAELAALPGGYAPPSGGLWLALDEGRLAAGCVGLRPMGGKTCELKRMYVRPEHRRSGLGRRLGQVAIEQARRLGYELIRLDTANFLGPALRLYASLGFREVEPFYAAPPDIMQIVIFMEMPLG